MTNDSGDERDHSRERTRRGDRDRTSRFSENSRDRSLDRGRDRGSKKPGGNTVYVSNIPYEFRWQDLKDLFRNEVGDVQFVELFVDEKDKSKGCGIVEFAENSSVKKCLQVMQRFEVKGRKLVVKEDSGNVRDKHGSVMSKRGGSGAGNRDHRDDRHYDSMNSFGGGGGGSMGGARPGSGNDNNTYGLSPNFLESLRIDLPLINRVFVANLDYNVDKKKLKEVFRLAGKIQRVELHTDKDGRSRGFAVIEYDHPVEAVQAISMFNNQHLYERQMTVRMDRANDVTKLPDGLKGIGMGLGSNGEPLKDVAKNIPSSNQTGGGTGLGAGILGAMPNSALQVASALTGLNNLTPGAFGGLASNASVLQAAVQQAGGLSGNLLNAAGLGGNSGNDLSLANSLVNNSLVQNTNQLAALTSLNNSTSNISSFGRNDNSFSGSKALSYGSGNSGNGTGFNNTGSGYGGNTGGGYSGSTGGGFSSSTGGGFSSSTGGGFSSSTVGYNSERETTAYNTIATANSLRTGGSIVKNESGFSRKIIITNLPTSANYKMLHEKFSEFGDIQHFEDKGNGNMIVMYATEWQAERAIKNLDRARIDGRTIEARFFI